MRRSKSKLSPGHKSIKSLLEELRGKYRSFKKTHAGRSPVPAEIKLLARSLVQSGVTMTALAKKLDISTAAISNWLRTSDGGDSRPSKAGQDFAESVLNASSSFSSQQHGWVKIRVSGHVMEIDWLDLVKRLPLLGGVALKKGEPMASAAEGQIDFNKAAHEDFDFTFMTDEFEKSLIRGALSRHRSITESCRAINLPRSTLDGKRRKHGLV